MTKQERAHSQLIEKVKKVEEWRRNSSISELFISAGHVAAVCTVCGGEFSKPRGSRLQVCSAECKRLRGLRHATAYRQQGREMRAALLERFGGKWPTREELFQLLQHR